MYSLHDVWMAVLLWKIKVTISKTKFLSLYIVHILFNYLLDLPSPNTFLLYLIYYHYWLYHFQYTPWYANKIQCVKLLLFVLIDIFMSNERTIHLKLCPNPYILRTPLVNIFIDSQPYFQMRSWQEDGLLIFHKYSSSGHLKMHLERGILR